MGWQKFYIWEVSVLEHMLVECVLGEFDQCDIIWRYIRLVTNIL